MKRDLTQEQFERAAKAYGFTPAYGGYWYIDEKQSVMIYAANAGDRRRNQLNYLRHCLRSHLRDHPVPS